MTDKIETQTVKLGDKTVPLTMPASLASRYDVLAAAGSNLNRAACAALGLAWTGPGKPKARYRYDVMEYGGQVLDELCGRGLRPVQVMAAAVVAFNLVTGGLIGDAEVDEAEGNSEAPDGSTSS